MESSTVDGDYNCNHFRDLANGYNSDDNILYWFNPAEREARNRLDAQIRNDEEFQGAFGALWSTLGQRNTRRLWEVKVDCPETVRFQLVTTSEWGGTKPTDEWDWGEWETLGAYLGNNTYVQCVNLDYCIRTPSATKFVPRMFDGLRRNRSIKSFNCQESAFDVDSIRSIIPFLENNSSLVELNMGRSTGITPDLFASLIGALHNGPIECIDFFGCSLGTIIEMEGFTLPNLRRLVLGSNGLKDEDCRVLSEFVKCEGSKVEELSIAHNDFGDEGAIYFAESLKNNTSLKRLYMGVGRNGTITENGVNAFSKVLSDVSSVKRTYTSNHTFLRLEASSKFVSMAQCPRVRAALEINRENVGNPPLAGRWKVIAFHLSPEVRRKTSELQGVEDFYMRPFTELDSFVLPEVMSLIGINFGKSELYRALTCNIASLLSLINKDAVAEDQLLSHETKRQKLM